MKNFTHTTQRGHSIPITVYGDFGTQPCVLYVHGFKGFKDWGFVPYAGKYFAERGISFVCFNFSHNGVGEDMQNFTEVEKFEKNTFSLEVEEIMEMIHLCVHTDFLGAYLTGELGLIGHSRGGGMAILAGSKSPDIDKICTWAAVSKVDRFKQALIDLWKKQGFWEVKNSRTGQTFRIKTDLLNDVLDNAQEDLNILKAVQDITKPLLVLHGADDETVPAFEAEALKIYGPQGLLQMRLIPNAGHTFGAKHPFEDSNPALESLLEQSLSFFKASTQD